MPEWSLETCTASRRSSAPALNERSRRALETSTPTKRGVTAGAGTGAGTGTGAGAGTGTGTGAGAGAGTGAGAGAVSMEEPILVMRARGRRPRLRRLFGKRRHGNGAQALHDGEHRG